MNVPTVDLFIQSLSSGVQFLLQRQQSHFVLFLHDGEISVVLLPCSGQRVGATEIHHLLLHAVQCCLGNPLLLYVLQRKTKGQRFSDSCLKMIIITRFVISQPSTVEEIFCVSA